MSERTYRTVGAPARLGARERDQVTGRRTADRSDKDRRSHRRSPRRALLAGGVGVVALVLIGAAAVAVGSGDGTEEVSATSTLSAGASTSAPAVSGSADPGEESPLNGRYAVTETIIDAFSYATPEQGGGGPIEENLGNTSTGEIFIDCVGSECLVIAGVFGLPDFGWEVDGTTLAVTSRRPTPGGDDSCAPQEDVAEGELTVDESGRIEGTFLRDRVPGAVPCGPDQGYRSGARYVTKIEGQRIE